MTFGFLITLYGEGIPHAARYAWKSALIDPTVVSVAAVIAVFFREEPYLSTQTQTTTDART